MRIPSKLDLVLWGLIGAGILALSLVFKSWHDDAQELPKVRDQVAQLQDDYDELEARAAENTKKTEDHGHDFDQAQQKLDADRADAPVTDVRLCVAPPVRKAARAPAREAAVTGDAASPGAGVLPQGAPEDPAEGQVAGPDIGPDLRALIDKADDVTLIAGKCQAWVKDNP